MLSRNPTICKNCSQDLLRTFFQAISNSSKRRPGQCRRLGSLAPRIRKPIPYIQFCYLPLRGFIRHKPFKRLPRRSHNENRTFSTTTMKHDSTSRKAAIFALVDDIHRQEHEIVQLLQGLRLLDDFAGLVCADDLDLVDYLSPIIGYRNGQDLEDRVRRARQQFGESLPQGELNLEEKLMYTRLYGEPIAMETDTDIVAEQETRPDQLFRDDGEGGLVKVELTGVDTWDAEVEPKTSEIGDESQRRADINQSALEQALAVAKQLGAEVVVDPNPGDNEMDAGPRAHPLTAMGKFGTEPRTVSLPRDTMVEPVTTMLSNFSNKHITETVHRIFGGPGLPHSTSTPCKLLPQLPIPLRAAQHN